MSSFEHDEVLEALNASPSTPVSSDTLSGKLPSQGEFDFGKSRDKSTDSKLVDLICMSADNCEKCLRYIGNKQLSFCLK